MAQVSSQTASRLQQLVECGYLLNWKWFVCTNSKYIVTLVDKIKEERRLE